MCCKPSNTNNKRDYKVTAAVYSNAREKKSKIHSQLITGVKRGPMSAEQKLLISKGNKGKKRTLEEIQNIKDGIPPNRSNPMKGRKHRQKIIGLKSVKEQIRVLTALCLRDIITHLLAHFLREVIKT